jgi:hypothetical protein
MKKLMGKTRILSAVLASAILIICKCAPSIHSIDADDHDFSKCDLPIVYGRIKFEEEKDGNYLVRRDMLGFINIEENKIINQIGYFKPNDSGYFLHQVHAGKIKIQVYEEIMLCNPNLSDITSIDKKYYYKRELGEIDLKKSSINYVGNITIKRISRSIDVIDGKMEADDWVRSKFKLIDSSREVKNIPYSN